MRNSPSLACVLALVSASILSASDPSPDLQFEFFRDLAETRNYTLGRPEQAQLTPDGATVIFLRGGPRDAVLRLYELDVTTGAERELLTPESLLGTDDEVISAQEKARRERSRVTHRGFTTFDLSHDGRRVLVTLSGRLFVLNRAPSADSQPMVIPLPGEGWIDPRFSPDGTAVAAVRAGELHVIEMATLDVRTLTAGAGDSLTHGLAEFVAQEEMSRAEGYWWSPDSRFLAYQQTDESKVEVRYVADPLYPEQPPTKFYYPKAGSTNAKVRLGVIAREGGETTWVHWDAEQYPYLARVAWPQAAAPLCVLVQDRHQQNQVLLAADPTTGDTRAVLREQDPAWLNLDGKLVLPRWLKSGRQFLWTTERNGQWQVELRAADGTLLHAITPPDFIYKELLHVDEDRGWVYVRGSLDPVESHVWRFPLADGQGRQLTAGRGMHDAVFARNAPVWLHEFTLIDGNRGTLVRDDDNTGSTALISVAEEPRQWPAVQLLRTGSDPDFNAAIVRPRNFQAGKNYPVILYVYAGPTTTVVTADATRFLTDQWMADQGYLVVRIDGRGTPYRGRAWERIVRGNLIDVALQDQVAGLTALADQIPELDLTRVGVTGWSFGGYFSAMAAMRRPDIFRCAVVGAPVITWENYDTYYTERYLGLPQENPGAYRVSSVLTYVDELRRPLLIFHGLTDDNVYFQHALQLADALYRTGKPHEIVPLTGTHMVNDPVVKLRQQQRIMEFFARHLRDQR
ncbi:MAG: DPP IV N-terminal domain-containing protein [Opitutaceae bacterium]|nr:DPP IV N-terminal domain-containing protein [Opitutaceae bacterium]